MPQTRLLRGLSTAVPRRASTVSSLAPPYSHALGGPTPPSRARPQGAFTPPYAHSLETEAKPADPEADPIAAPYRFTVIQNAASVEQARSAAWSVWATDALSTDKGRDRLRRLWSRSINALDKANSLNQVPQVSFRGLAEHLSSISSFESLARAGTFVVRDVVADDEAQTWAVDLLKALQERGGRPVFWHDALLAARAHHNVRSANNQVLQAFCGTDKPAFILADTVQVGLGSSPALTTTHAQLWDAEASASMAPWTPITSHLTLTPSLHGNSTVAPSIHSAIYASLRPLFRPIKSRLSLYDASAYLDPTNWELLESAPVKPVLFPTSLPHIEASSTVLPSLLPGDLVVRHSSIPLAPGADEGIYLPVSPLPRLPVNELLVAEQKRAFEEGIPPTHIHSDGLVALERAGSSSRIPSNGGRRAMGYE